MDLRQDMPKLIDLIRTSLRGDIGVETRVAADLWPIEVDPSEFELALLNIVVNARDAMPKGGRLKLAARNRTFSNNGGHAADLAGDFVEFAIADTGHGIPAAVLPRVFEPFFTTKEVGKGTGLGLSQVYGFAKQTGGGVTITSEPGVGTTVRLLLPRSVALVPADAAEPRPQAAAQSISTILLVEDNDEVADTTAAILEDLGYEARRARNAGEALTMLSNGGSFDLLLSDIVMPGGTSGLDLARTVRQRFPALPILLTTGYSTAAREAAAEGLTILQKPYRRQTLASALGQFLEPRSASEAPAARSYPPRKSVIH
jgi:two-component system NtrC family sensor kinase